MAIIRQLDVVFSGAGALAPKLTSIDKLESDGSLLLVDVSHPFERVHSGGVNINDTLPNLFADTLSTLSGSSLVDSLAYGNLSAGSQIFTERTSKGGIHGVVKQVANFAVTDEYGIKYPQALISYMNANKSHDYYVSLWQRTSRASNYPSGGLYPRYQQLASGGSSILVTFGTNGHLTNSSALGSNHTSYGASPNAETNHLFAFAGDSVPSGGLTDTQSMAWFVGADGAWNNSNVAGSADELPSQIFYRTYVEDLTVSGRTYDEVYAIDQELYTKEVLTLGGRFYGDTFTDPDTVIL